MHIIPNIELMVKIYVHFLDGIHWLALFSINFVLPNQNCVHFSLKKLAFCTFKECAYTQHATIFASNIFSIMCRSLQYLKVLCCWHTV